MAENEKPRIVDIGVKNPFKIAVDDMRERMPYMIEYAELNAKLKRTAYLQYLKEGFTEAQALELCKTA